MKDLNAVNDPIDFISVAVSARTLETVEFDSAILQ
jgi:hypothetical protein